MSPRFRSSRPSSADTLRTKDLRTAALLVEIEASDDGFLTMQEVAEIFGITPNEASIWMTEFQRVYPNTITWRRIRVVNLPRRGDARTRDARP
jgi:hypothetical protein